MKKLLCALLLCVNLPALACDFKIVDDPGVRSAIKRNGGYPVSDQVCELLNKHGMSLWVDADATVLNGANIGTAVVAVWKQGVISDAFGRSVTLHSGGVGSQNTAEVKMVEAIRQAIQNMDFDAGIKQVNSYAEKLRKRP